LTVSAKNPVIVTDEENALFSAKFVKALTNYFPRLNAFSYSLPVIPEKIYTPQLDGQHGHAKRHSFPVDGN
jgi:hypothetical protein